MKSFEEMNKELDSKINASGKSIDMMLDKLGTTSSDMSLENIIKSLDEDVPLDEFVGRCAKLVGHANVFCK